MLATMKGSSQKAAASCSTSAAVPNSKAETGKKVTGKDDD
jgi:hypothetical protein